MDKQALIAVVQFLKKNNLKDTEALLKKEANITDEDIEQDANSSQLSNNVTTVLAAYKSDEDPSLYEHHYVLLTHFVEKSLDVHRCELARILYPVFVHMYLELVFNDYETQAKHFFDKFCHEQDDCYTDDLQQLAMVSKSYQMRDSQLLDSLKSSKFTVRMSRESYGHLKRFLSEKNLTTLLTIIHDRLVVDVFDGVPRNKQLLDTTGRSILGDTAKDANKCKVLYGLLKEPEINIPLDDDEDETAGHEDGKSSKKRKPKKDLQMMKKAKNDPNAPPVTRIPLPEMKDSDKLEKARAYKELTKKVHLGADVLPSVIFYTFVNSSCGLTSVEICEDASLMSAGFSDSVVRVWSLTSAKLRSIKSSEELNIIDKEADDVLEHIMDDRSATDSKVLHGHSGPVYSSCFSPDKNHLISSSEDGTVRLWSLHTWTSLVCYKGHTYPVWSVKYGPQGHYFASGGYDRTARLWSTDHYQPLRIFAGHHADVDCVDFHPNSNYIATGSSDRTVRLWDVLSGNCVRVMTGHKGSVHALTFSPDGRYLASSGVDALILLWDLSTGELISQLKGHTDTVYSLAFSREGTILASGGRDNVVKIWDVNKVLTDQGNEALSSEIGNDGTIYELSSFSTKSTSVQCVHFNRRNLLFASGAFVHS
jgi:transcription initiation factor TFIID subunit 5